MRYRNKLCHALRLFRRPKIGGLEPEYLSMFGSKCHSGRRVVGATVGLLSRPGAGWAFCSRAVQRLRHALTCAVTCVLDWLLMSSLG